jgi:hypothetical protein
MVLISVHGQSLTPCLSGNQLGRSVSTQLTRHWTILRDMTQTNTGRSNCQFVVQQAPDGKVVVVVQLHQTIPSLQNSVVGFDLLGGTRAGQAKKLVDLLNEYVLGVFVTVTEKGATA